MISDDYGTTWTATKSPMEFWNTVYSDPSGKRIVAGPLCNGASSYCPPLSVSSDRGITWSNAAGIQPTNFYQDIVGDSTGMKLWTYGMSTLYVSGNGGMNWFPETLPYVYGPNNCGDGVAIDSTSTHAYAVSEGYLYYSSNGGTSWVRNSVKDPSCGTWRSFATDSTGQYVYAVSDYCFYVSLNFGGVFSLVKSYPDKSHRFKKVDCDGSGKFAYVAQSDAVWVYTRSTQLFTQTSVTGGITGVASSSSGQRAIASVSGGDLYTTKDYGSTWVAN